VATITHPTARDEITKREEDYRQALATLRLEGLEPAVEADAIFQRYARSELTLEEMGAEIDKLHERQFGPVPLSGD